MKSKFYLFPHFCHGQEKEEEGNEEEKEVNEEKKELSRCTFESASGMGALLLCHASSTLSMTK